MPVVTIRHKGLGATAEINEDALPDWEQVGWARAKAPTNAERAAESAPPRPKKAAPTNTESE